MQKINFMKNELVFKKIGAVCNHCNSYSPIGTIRMNIEIDLDDNFNYHLSQDTLVDNPFKVFCPYCYSICQLLPEDEAVLHAKLNNLGDSIIIHTDTKIINIPQKSFNKLIELIKEKYPDKDYSNSNIEFIEYGITIDIEGCKIIPNFNSISCIYTQNIKDFFYNARRFIEEIL